MTWINPPWLFDLSREGTRATPNFESVLGSGELFRYRQDGGPSYNQRLEEQFSAYFLKEAAVAVSSGTAALRLALRALGVGAGDRVLVSGYSFIACAMSVAGIGAVPVPMDVGGSVLELDVAATRRQIRAASAVLAVHVQGHAVPLAEIRELCDNAGVPLIEDACQAIGAASPDGLAGSLGDVVVTSFQQAKQIATGEGGLLAGSQTVVNRAYRLADLGAVRNAGLPDWDAQAATLGENLRLTEFQAALALDQLQTLDTTVSRQHALREELRRRISHKVMPVTTSAPGLDSGGHTLLLARTSQEALAFCGRLAQASIAARIVWPKTFVEFGVMQRLAGMDGHTFGSFCGKASALAPRIISVTLSKYTRQEVVERVADVIVSNADLLNR